MGRALEPGIRFPVYLDYDMSKHERTRPVFYANAPSMRTQAALAGEYDKCMESWKRDEATAETVNADLVRVLNMAFHGWDHQYLEHEKAVIDFSPDRWPDVITTSEAFELIGKALRLGRVDSDTKKNCESPDTSGQESSAEVAEVASAKS